MYGAGHLTLMEDQATARKRRAFIGIAFLVSVVAAAAAILLRRWRQQRAARPPERRPPAPPVVPEDIEGLTESEAQVRRVEGQDNAIYFKPSRSPRDIFRENIYTVFNLSLVFLAVAQLLLRDPLSALASLGTILLNVGLNAGQELLARRRLRDVQQAARPTATVIREGKARSVDPAEVVTGDMVVVGPGDQLLVDGQLVGKGHIVVDESMLSAEDRRVTKEAGDKVLAGSFCVSGRAVCEAQEVGDERWVAVRLAATQAGKNELTALERAIDRILRVLLAIVIVFAVLLLLRYFRLDTSLPVDTEMFTEAMSVIFSIAPSSLFFMIILAYAAGTVDLAKLGALVHQARSVESLAQATVICFARAGILVGTHVELETIEPPADRERLADSRIRQILGDYVRSISVDNLATRAMANTFEGNRRAVREEAPFLSVYGWSAVAFDDADLRGVYVLGDPQILEPHLVGEVELETEPGDRGSPLTAVRETFAPVGRFFRRFRSSPTEEAATTEKPAPREGSFPGNAPPSRDEALSLDGTPSPEGTRPKGQDSASDKTLLEGDTPPEDEASAEEDEGRQNLFRRLMGRANRILRRREEEKEGDEAPEEEPVPTSYFVLAYHPELGPLHDADGQPQLPDGLIPLANLRYSERVRPEAIETIRTFSRTGINIKIFSSGAPDRTVAILEQAGLGQRTDSSLRAITGAELAELEPAQLVQVVSESMVFGHLTAEQAGQVVAALRGEGELVAVVGDGVNDLPAMRQANLAVTRHSSSQAALSAADIVLLEDSPKALQSVLAKGQRIGHGLLDILRLHLTHVTYLALLIACIVVAFKAFPFRSMQVTVISIATLALPSIGLSIWGAVGVLPSTNLGRLLARFVAPAAITTGAAAAVVFSYFLEQTGDVSYAQLTLTYTVVLAGLLLVVFVRPPLRPRLRGDTSSGDWRPAVLVLVAMVLFFILAAIPLAQRLLYLDWLRQPEDYLFIGFVVLAWAVLLRFIWLIVPFGRTGRD